MHMVFIFAMSSCMTWVTVIQTIRMTLPKRWAGSPSILLINGTMNITRHFLPQQVEHTFKLRHYRPKSFCIKNTNCSYIQAKLKHASQVGVRYQRRNRPNRRCKNGGPKATMGMPALPNPRDP